MGNCMANVLDLQNMMLHDMNVQTLNKVTIPGGLVNDLL